MKLLTIIKEEWLILTYFVIMAAFSCVVPNLIGYVTRSTSNHPDMIPTFGIFGDCLGVVGVMQINVLIVFLGCICGVFWMAWPNKRKPK